MTKAVFALCIALFPALFVWWQSRRLLRNIESPTLAEQWWQLRMRIAQLTAVAGVLLSFLAGWYALAVIPLIAVAALAAGFPLRRALLGESWSFSAYLGWLLRLVVVFAGVWMVLLVTPLLVSAFEAEMGWGIVAAAILLVALLTRPQRSLLTVLGAEEVVEHDLPELEAFAREVDERSRTVKPRLFRSDLGGGVWANAMALPDPRSPVVVFSNSLLELLTVDEQCAIYAHELAHLEYYNPHRLRRISFAMWALSALALAVAPLSLALSGSSSVGNIAWAVLLFLVVMWRANTHQRNEAASDLRAVELCRQPEALISALEKVHVAARIPRRLAGDEERRMTHPSLARRVQAIRNAAGTGDAGAAPGAELEAVDEGMTIAAIPGGAGRYVLFEARRITWLDGVPTQAVGDPAAMRQLARSTRSVPYQELSELRIARKSSGRTALVVGDLRQHTTTTALNEADAASVQAHLDTVDGLLAETMPPSFASRMAHNTMIARVAAGLLFLNAFFVPGGVAIALLALIAAILPRASWLIAASLSALGGLLLAHHQPTSSFFLIEGDLSTMHLIVLIEACFLLGMGIVRALAVPTDRHRWAWLTPGLISGAVVATWAALVVGSWLMADGGMDVYRLNRWVRGCEELIFLPVAAAGSWLVAVRRRFFWTAIAPLLFLVPALWIGSDSFRARHVDDPFIAVDPVTTIASTITPELLWQREVPTAAQNIRLAPAGELLAFSSSRTNLGSKPVSWTLLRHGEKVREISAVDLGFDESGAVVAIVGDGDHWKLTKLGGDDDWELRVPKLDSAKLRVEAHNQLWSVIGAREIDVGHEAYRCAGTLGASTSATTRIEIEDDYFWPGSVTWLGDAGMLRRSLPDFDEPDESSIWKMWFQGDRTRLEYHGPMEGQNVPDTSVLALQCETSSIQDPAALCVADDGDRIHLWRLDAHRLSHPAHVSSIAAKHVAINFVDDRWVVLASFGQSLLLNRQSGVVASLNFGSDHHGAVVAIAGDALAVSQWGMGSHSLQVYRLPPAG